MRSAPLDIVYVIGSMIVGGTQTHLLQVFRFLDRDRFRPHLFVLRDGGGLVSQAEELDVPVRSFGMRGAAGSGPVSRVAWSTPAVIGCSGKCCPSIAWV